MKRILSILFFAQGLSAFAQVSLSSSLIACYALNGNAVETVNNLTGTLSSVTSITGHLGVANTACYFNGDTSSSINLPKSPLLKSNEISFSAWVKADTLKPEMAILFSRNTSTLSNYTAYYAVTIKYYNGAYRFGVLRQKDYTGYYPASLTAVNVNTWYHVAFAMSSATMQVYVNGVYESYLAIPTSFTYDPSQYVILGGTNESQFTSFKGSLDNVLFYNRVLSPNEISVLYYQDPDCSILSTALEEAISESEVKVFPNPTNGKLILETIRERFGNYEIYDLLGSLIFSGKTGLATRNEIDLTVQPAGVYFLKIKHEESWKVIKIVKE